MTKPILGTAGGKPLAIDVACERCGKKRRRYPSELARGRGRFCSKACKDQRAPDAAERAKIRKQQWVEANREHVAAYQRSYRQAHPELREYHARRYREKRSEILARQRTYLAMNREQRRAYVRDYQARNREALAQKARKRRQANRGEILEHERAKRATNRPLKRQRDAEYRVRRRDVWIASIEKSRRKKPELYREIAQNRSLRRRARLKAAPIEKVQPSRVFDRDGGVCHLCNELVTSGNRSLDHLIPIARGGAHAEWNLATAHRRCNQRRGVRELFSPETREQAESYIEARRRATAPARCA